MSYGVNGEIENYHDYGLWVLGDTQQRSSLLAQVHHHHYQHTHTPLVLFSLTVLQDDGFTPSDVLPHRTAQTSECAFCQRVKRWHGFLEYGLRVTSPQMAKNNRSAAPVMWEVY